MVLIKFRKLNFNKNKKNFKNNFINIKYLKKYFFFETSKNKKLNKFFIKNYLNSLYQKFINKIILSLLSKGKKNYITKVIKLNAIILLKKKKIKLQYIINQLLKYLNMGLKFKKVYKSGKKYLVPTVLLYNQKYFYLFFKGYLKNLKNKTYKNKLNLLIEKTFVMDLYTFYKTKNDIKTNNAFKQLKTRYIKNLKNSHLHLKLYKKKKRK